MEEQQGKAEEAQEEGFLITHGRESAQPERQPRGEMGAKTWPCLWPPIILWPSLNKGFCSGGQS